MSRGLHCLLLITLLCLGGLRAFAQTPPADTAWTQMLERMYRYTVPMMRVADLNTRLGKPGAPVLLDTRSPREYQVSHIQGALLADYDHLDLSGLAGLPRDREIVVYCSVGYRSERVGEKLRAAGFTQVRNLYGGIFEWINAGLPVVDSGNRPVRQVHGYNADWGRWVKRGKVVYR